MKHIIPEFAFPADPHTVIENSDFGAIDKMYAGRKAYYGDFHVHAATGGTSDGQTTLADWRKAMDNMHIDFVGIMDHRQVRHMYLEDFDPEYFLYGSEPAGLWHEPRLIFHYLMIFQDRGALERVLEKYPDVFEFEGGTEGHFKYIRVDHARFMEVKDAVIAEGGAFIHAHPKQQMESTNVDDFNFGDGTGMEIIYTPAFKDELNEYTVANYKVWMKLLEKGVKMYNTGTSDAHYAPRDTGLNAVYAEEKSGPCYTKYLRTGDVNSGYVAVKMCMGENPVGSTVKYKDGLELQVKVEDAHELKFDPTQNYRVDIITDKGLAYSAPLTMPFAAAIKVEKRAFYRVEVLRDYDGAPMAIGNPIWVEE